MTSTSPNPPTPRTRSLTAAQLRRAKEELASLVDELILVEVTEDLVNEASHLAEMEALRGYDAVHLAAALMVETTVLTSADSGLCDAAHRRGLHVANPLVA